MLAALKQRLFGDSSRAAASSSKSMARSRLHFVLVQDRAGLSSGEMAKFKEEMVNVIERYFVIDKAGFDISYKRDSDSSTLLINSPILVRKRENPGRDDVATKKGGKSDSSKLENPKLENKEPKAAN